MNNDNKLDQDVYNMILNDEKDTINAFIDSYTPFIINAASQHKNAYLDANNDDEYSIALLAFHEAMKKFDPSKGRFLSFARLVINSRLTNYWNKEKKLITEQLDDNLVTDNHNQALKDEIELFEIELSKINLTFEDLVQFSPKHKATREKTALLGRKVSLRELWMVHLYTKKRLPITQISSENDVSIKVIKTHKKYIASIALVFYNKLDLISSWIKFDKKGPKI